MTIDVAKITEGEDACESKAVKRSDGKEVRSTVPCLRKVSHNVVMCSQVLTFDSYDYYLGKRSNWSNQFE